MAKKALPAYSYADYLALEQNPEVKYEFHDGLITAMAGGALKHAQISANTIWALNDTLRRNGKGCTVFSSDARVRIKESNRAFYPDITFVCDPIELSEDDQHTITNPQLLIESPFQKYCCLRPGCKIHPLSSVIFTQRICFDQPG